jgi:hypothetical protein
MQTVRREDRKKNNWWLNAENGKLLI